MKEYWDHAIRVDGSSLAVYYIHLTGPSNLWMATMSRPNVHDPQLRERLRAQFGYRCGYCSVSESTLGVGGVLAPEVMSIDHYLPRRLFPGQSLEDGGLVYACRYCNRAKGSRNPYDGERRLLHRGMREYASQLRWDRDGTVSALGPLGEFTIDVARLNEPVKVRLRLLEIDAWSRIDELLRVKAQLLSALHSADSRKAHEITQILDQLERLAQSLSTAFPQPLELEPRPAHIYALDRLAAEKELTPYVIRHLKDRPSDLRRLDPHVCEELVAEFFASWGYGIQLLGRNSSTGADILALRRPDRSGAEIRYLIEVKRERHRIGIEEIHRVLGVLTLEKARHGWDVAFLFSIGGFTDFRNYTPDVLRRHGVFLRGETDVLAYLESYQPRADGGLWLPSRLDDSLLISGSLPDRA